MRSRKRVEITVETRQLVIRRRTDYAPVWCTECSAAVHLITPEEAALMAGVSPAAISRLAEQGHLHFVETDAGGRLICLNSLPPSISADGCGDGEHAQLPHPFTHRRGKL